MHLRASFVAICGQAPSDYPDLVEHLVRLGIDSISLNPDVVFKTTLNVLEVECKLAHTLPENPATSAAREVATT